MQMFLSFPCITSILSYTWSSDYKPGTFWKNVWLLSMRKRTPAHRDLSDDVPEEVKKQRHIVGARSPTPGIWLLGGWLAEWLALLRVRAYVRCRCRFTKVKRFSCKTVSVCPSVRTPRKEITLDLSISVLH